MCKDKRNNESILLGGQWVYMDTYLPDHLLLVGYKAPRPDFYTGFVLCCSVPKLMPCHAQTIVILYLLAVICFLGGVIVVLLHKE